MQRRSLCTADDVCTKGACGGAAVTCDDDNNACTVSSCDGATGCVYPPAAAGFVCRASGGACDVAETCDGTTAPCSGDVLQSVGEVCRASGGECDVPEACSGTSATCPTDAVKSKNTLCSDDGNPCSTDLCNGNSADCKHAAGNAGADCRLTSGSCDVIESCTGTSTTCPADGFMPTTTVCRAATGVCDVADSCTGSNASCPGDAVAADGTTCSDSDACTQSDACVTGVCAGTNPVTCSASDQCHVAGICDSASGTCSNPDATDGTACDDGDAITVNDACAGGICVAADACHGPATGTTISTPFNAGGSLYVTNQDAPNVAVFAPGADGDAAPTTTIEGSNTGLDIPRGIGRDATGNVYVANYGTNAVTVYASGASGNATPIRVIVDSNTLINGPEGLAVDGAGNVYVANQTDHKVLVFTAGANGNVAPFRKLVGSCTGLRRPVGVALDQSGNLYVANLGVYNSPSTASVTVYAAGANGNSLPLTTIAGGSTGLFNPLGITLDAGGSIYVANYGDTDAGPSNFATRVVVFAPGSSGNAAPARTIIGTMSEPTGLVLDPAGQLYVTSFFGQFITVYGAGAEGLATPVASISGPNTGINRPAYVTF